MLHLIGAPDWLGFVFAGGWFDALARAIFASWGMCNLIAIVLEHRVLIPSQQYQSFYKGDLFGLPPLVAVSKVLIDHLPEATGRWYQSAWWHYGMLAVGLAIGVGLTVMEHRSGVYTLGQIFSPFKLYHNVIVFPAFIYWLLGCGLPALIYSSLGVPGVIRGGLMALALMVAAVAALAYWSRLIIRELRMSEEEHAAKQAHLSISAREAVWAVPVMVTLGIVLALGAPNARGPILLLTGFLAALVYYANTVSFDMTGQNGPKPWAHVPFRWRYCLPWQRKPWPFSTRSLPEPAVYLAG